MLVSILITANSAQNNEKFIMHYNNYKNKTNFILRLLKIGLHATF